MWVYSAKNYRKAQIVKCYDNFLIFDHSQKEITVFSSNPGTGV